MYIVLVLEAGYCGAYRRYWWRRGEVLRRLRVVEVNNDSGNMEFRAEKLIQAITEL